MALKVSEGLVDVVKHLLQESLEDHPLVRLQAVIALGRLGQASAGPILLYLMRDQLPEVRYQAVRGIGLLKLEGAVEHVEPLPLGKALDDVDQHDFVGQFLVDDPLCRGGADVTRSDDCDFHEFPLCLDVCSNGIWLFEFDGV